MAAQTASRADATVREAFGYPCDVCHSRRGVEVFDQYWVCKACRMALAEQLELELNS